MSFNYFVPTLNRNGQIKPIFSLQFFPLFILCKSHLIFCRSIKICYTNMVIDYQQHKFGFLEQHFQHKTFKNLPHKMDHH